MSGFVIIYTLLKRAQEDKERISREGQKDSKENPRKSEATPKPKNS